MLREIYTSTKWVLFLAPLFLYGITPTSAQNNFFVRHYDESQGLSSNFTEAVTQSTSGHLIIASKGGLDRFDGRTFQKLKADTSELDFVTSLYQTETEVWFGLFNGKIGSGSEIDGINIINTGINGQVKHIYKDSDDGIWAFSRSGMVFWLNGSDTSRFSLAEQDMLITAVIPYKDKEFIIGSNDGLWLIRFENGNDLPVLQHIEGLPETKITALKYQTEKDILWVGTEDDGLYRVYSPFSKDQNIEEFVLHTDESIDDVQTIYSDRQGNFWLGTFGNGLLRIEFYGEDNSEYVTQRFNEDLSDDLLIRGIFEDSENNIWVATFGGGLVQIVEKVFHQPFDGDWLRQQSITQLFRDSKGNVWLGIDKGLFKTSLHAKKSKYEYYYLGGNQVSAITEDKYGKIYVGTTTAGVYVLPNGANDFNKIPIGTGNLSQAINSITSTQAANYISTKAGLFIVDFKGKVRKHLSTIDGLPHNNIKYCFEDTAGRLWMATQGNRVSYYKDEQIRFVESGSEQTIQDVNHILQDGKGRLWFATLGQGVFVLDNGTATALAEKDGLPSSYCYQMVLDNDGNVWVGHQKSISRISPELIVSRVVDQKDISPTENSMISFIFKDQEGNIWISSTHNVVKFSPTIDKLSKSIPQLSISGMRVFNNHQTMTKNLELPYKRYSIKFELAGISFRDPENIRYKYQLKGFSDFWSEEQSSNIIDFPRLEEGTYKLSVIASKNGGEWTPIPVEYAFSIKRPIWKTWYFYLFSFAALVGIIIGFVRYRTYRLVKDKAELEEEVGKRTLEINEQKEEIERSRDEIAKYAKDITDSIKYAKRIQKAIFPDIRDIQNTLPESFVLFQSKDLVSGDFYIAEKIGSKRIFAAVDCTGHGVPGGFMSIVANNLLSQAINQEGLTKPSEILEYLNLGVTNTLHQTYEESSVKDGMDIALCCWDMETDILEFSGAYNPLYLFRNGKLIEYKGNRFPVGTFVGEEIRQFTNHEIKVEKGDVIYLFSDGFSDQFGGPDGKKFKLRRFKAMLQDIHTHPMDKQYELSKKLLNNWMGNLEQVDDIVLMGVRIT